MTTPAPDDVCQHENCGKPRALHHQSWTDGYNWRAVSAIATLPDYCFANGPRQTFLAPPAKDAADPYCTPDADGKIACPTCAASAETNIADLRAQLAAKEARIGELQDERDDYLRQRDKARTRDSENHHKWLAVQRLLEEKRVERWHATRDAAIAGLCGHPASGLFVTMEKLVEQATKAADAAHGTLGKEG
jgi:uncharacterized Zn finger protein (UPF0148 family)